MATTILVADDNLTIQRTAAEVLSSGGLKVVTVANGMAAIKKIPILMPLVVVADVDMPGKDGYEVCEFVKAQPDLVHIRVLLAVSDTDPYDEERGKRVRADGVIKKPFVREELTSLVVKSIEQAQLLFPAAPAPPGEPERALDNELSGQETMPAAGETNEDVIEGGTVAALPAEGILEPPALASHTDSSNEIEPARAPEECRADSSPAEALVNDEMTPFEKTDSAPELALANRVEAWANSPSLPEAPESDLDHEDPSGSDFSKGPPACSPPVVIGAPSDAPSLLIPDFFAPSDMLETEYGAFALSELAPNLPLKQEEPQGAPVCEEDCESPAMIEDTDAVETPVHSSAATFEILPPALPETPFVVQEPASESSLDDFPAVPGSQIDPALVSSVINAVVKRIAPPALSPEMIQSLECKLMDEILSELALGSRPEA